MRLVLALPKPDGVADGKGGGINGRCRPVGRCIIVDAHPTKIAIEASFH
jgi:hypothetical protein